MVTICNIVCRFTAVKTWMLNFKYSRGQNQSPAHHLTIQYTYMTCPTSNKTLCAIPTANIEYPIKSGERTGSYKHYIKHQSTSWSIQYSLGDAIGLARHWLNIMWMYAMVSLTGYWILYGSCYWISQTMIECTSSALIGQSDSVSNIV
jgi:hypothetical protein